MLNNLSVNTIRFLSMDEINTANSGHPGVVLGVAPIAYTLFHDHLRINPKYKDYFNRDRFILGSGHASSMLYSILHLAGYNISIDDLKKFRKLGSITPGHPELGVTDGLDASSGPLGQGIPTAAGLALAETILASRFNKPNYNLIDHYTFVEVGDGDFQEGVTLEALELIGHLNLNKLIILFDSNRIQLDGPVSNAGGFKDSKAYFESLGFNYLSLDDVENLDKVSEVISLAKKSDKPSVIEFKTIIGYKSVLEGTSKVHGAPLGIENTNLLREAMNYPYKEFEVDTKVYQDFKEALDKNIPLIEKWNNDLLSYKSDYPELYDELIKIINDDHHVSVDLFNDFEFKAEATRQTIGNLINKLSDYNKTLIAGSADLTASTHVKGVDGNYSKDNRNGRNICYGVREHAMGAISNGLTLHHLRSLTGAFFVFSDYMKPAIRMAALSNLPSIFIFSHDSIAVGEDGPTHEAIEQIAALRATPNVLVFRPSDSYTTMLSLVTAMNTKDTPSVILLTRQGLPLLNKISYDDFNKGAVIRLDFDKIDGTLVATGSEVSLALDTAKILKEEGLNIRVVEITSTNLFDKLDKIERDKYIPANLPSMFVEMSTSFGLHKYAKEVYAIDTFGKSGNVKDLLVDFGFTKEALKEAFKKIL